MKDIDDAAFRLNSFIQLFMETKVAIANDSVKGWDKHPSNKKTRSPGKYKQRKSKYDGQDTSRSKKNNKL